VANGAMKLLGQSAEVAFRIRSPSESEIQYKRQPKTLPYEKLRITIDMHAMIAKTRFLMWMEHYPVMLDFIYTSTNYEAP
jgi:hypothetical protein